MQQRIVKIRDISQQFGVSTRTLRYYEQIGLLSSVRSDAYAYRMYDQDAIMRLRQILVLRKLQISIRDISQILKHDDVQHALCVFLKQVDQVDRQIQALQSLKQILQALVVQLRGLEENSQPLEMESLYQDALQQLQSIAFEQQERKLPTMDELQQSDHILSALQQVRIVRLPPMRFAAYRAISESPEKDCWDVMLPWYHANNLDLVQSVRVFGHNNPDPDGQNPAYGYEVMISIPPDVGVQAPLYELEFTGGLYAAHVCTLANIGEVWQGLIEWSNGNEQYAPDFSGFYSHHPGLEETLNMDALNHQGDMQLDILLPIALRKE